jgi:hypothetical protein
VMGWMGDSSGKIIVWWNYGRWLGEVVILG